jgi:hypothetical protein
LLCEADPGRRHDKHDRLARRIGLPATYQLQSIAQPLSVMQMPYRDPANEWRSARERHGQTDVMPGVRRYDLS